MAETLPEAAAPGTGQQFKLVDVSTTPSEGGCGCGCGGHGKKEQAAPAAPATESHGGCGCGGHGHQAEAAPARESHGGCGCGGHGHGAQEAPKAEAAAHGGCGCGDHGLSAFRYASQCPLPHGRSTRHQCGADDQRHHRQGDKQRGERRPNTMTAHITPGKSQHGSKGEDTGHVYRPDSPASSDSSMASKSVGPVSSTILPSRMNTVRSDQAA